MLEEIGNISKDIQEYLEIKFDLLKIQMAENISAIVSKTILSAVIIILLSCVLLFLSLAAGFFMASLLDSNELGFLCVAGFYFLLGLMILAMRKKIIERPVIKSVIKIFFPKKTGDEKK